MYSIPGLTSPKVQKFLNGICKTSNSYLEIGSYLGATSVAALDNNSLHAFFVDTWAQPIRASRNELEELPKNSKDIFVANVKKYKGNNKINIFDCDMFDVDISELRDIEVFFYNGSHDEEITTKAVEYYAPTLSKNAILIFDNANLDGVVRGAIRGMYNARMNVTYDKIILTDKTENKNGFWNGLYVVLLKG